MYRQSDLPDDPVTVYCMHYQTELLSPALNSQLIASGMLALDLTTVNVSQATHCEESRPTVLRIGRECANRL
jgi:hypothetical protein